MTNPTNDHVVMPMYAGPSVQPTFLVKEGEAEKRKFKTIDLEQGTSEWLAWRSSGVTATDSVTLLGKNPYGGTPFTLWRVKTNRADPEDLSRNPNVRRGQKMEPQIRSAIEERYAAQTGHMLLPLCVENVASPHLKASLDGITDQGEPVEIKAPSEKTWKAVNDQQEQSVAYQMYRVQVMHQMLVTGSERGYLVFGFMEGAVMRLKLFTIQRDDELISDIIISAKQFNSNLRLDQAPELDPEKDVFVPSNDTDAARWTKVADAIKYRDQQIKDLEMTLKSLKSDQKHAQKSMKEMMGAFQTGEFAGVRLSTYEVKGKINYQGVIEDHLPDLGERIIETYRGPSRHQERLTITGRELEKGVKDEEQLKRLEVAKDSSSSAYLSW